MLCPANMPSIALTEMTSMDDQEDFLELFEHAAASLEWLAGEWAPQLLPLLCGKAQLAAQQQLPRTHVEYSSVKRSVLQLVGWTPEEYH